MGESRNNIYSSVTGMYPYLLSAGSLMREKGWAFFFFKPQLVPIFAGLLCKFELYMTVSSRCP